MNGNKWLGLVIGLALALCTSFALMRKMSAPLPKYVSTIDGADAAGKTRAVRTEKGVKTAVSKQDKVAVDYDALWQNTLFNEARKEGENGLEAAAQAEQGRPMNNSEFEVVGLASIGRKGATVPVAIIVQTKNAARSSSARNAGRMGGNRRPVQKTAEPEATDQSNRRVDRNIFRAGDKVGTTGYTVKSIIIDENKVILTRAGVELVLVLDESNTSNSVRRESVKQEAIAQQEQFRAKEKAEAQKVQEQKQRDAEQKEMQERVRNFAKARGQNISQEEVQRRVAAMQRFQQMRQQQMQQQNQQNQQQNKSGQSGRSVTPSSTGNRSTPPGPPSIPSSNK